MTRAYTIAPDGRSITCPHCGLTSHNPNDAKLGATGKYPQGSLGPHDKGELRAALSRNSRGDVQIDFGTEIAWVCLPPKDAINLARAIAKKAGAKRVKIE